jgi:hypothetical protein
MEWKPGIPEDNGDYYFRSAPGKKGKELKASPVTVPGNSRSRLIAYLSEFENLEHLGPFTPEMLVAYSQIADAAVMLQDEVDDGIPLWAAVEQGLTYCDMGTKEWDDFMDKISQATKGK